MSDAMHQRRATDRPLRPTVLAWAALILVVLVAAVVAGRVTAPRLTVRAVESAPVPRALPANVERFHDAEEEVTCWRPIGSGGISCLPDQWLASARGAEE